jgi:branched-chain amino acid transport system substrate-binding protein
MKRARWLTPLAAIGVFALIAVACTSSSSSGTGSATTSGSVSANKINVTIYGQGAWTGPYNYLVVPSMQGASLRASELNADASFPAYITFTAGDTQGSGDQAPAVVQQVVSDPNTVGVVGPAFSGESEASGDSYEQAQIPFVTASATAADLSTHGWTYWYRTVAGDTLQGGDDGTFLGQVVGSKKLFLVNDKEAYGQGLTDQVKKTAPAAGAQIVGEEGVAQGTDDWSPVLSQIKSSGADTVFFGGYDADFAKFVKQGKDGGLNVNWMSGDGSVSSTFLDSAGGSAEGVYQSIASDLSGSFTKKYNAAYGTTASTVPVYAAEGYDVMSLLGAGIQQAIQGGATTPTDIRLGIKSYLDSLTVASPFKGVAKNIAFTQPEHELIAADPNSLLWFYQVKNGATAALGLASDLLKPTTQ